MHLKSFIPSRMRKFMRLSIIKLKDLTSGKKNKFAKSSRPRIYENRSYHARITIAQPINISEWAANKKHNLRLAISKFQNLPIYPNEVFSFWHFVGNPSKKHGYKVGINIIKKRLDFDYGGGLCQLSGLLYHLALTAGLEIVERYPHSVDLYTDETRYTPLGSDATTAYGYKDLRLKNSLNTPFCFHIYIEGERLIGSICAPEKITEFELLFDKKIIDGKEIVKTWRRRDSEEYEFVCEQSYTISNHGQVL